MKKYLPISALLFWFCLPMSLLAQPGSTCANPFVLNSLPFVQTGMTTCGFGDEFSSLDACGSSYLNGDDFVFTYTSPGNETIDIVLANTLTWVGLFVMDGCPSTATTNCINPTVTGGACTGGFATNTQSGGNPSGTWDLVNPGTYYIVISTFPTPDCTPFDISITASTSTGGGVGSGCYTVATGIPFNPDPFNQGTVLSFPDDRFSATLPIGFDFCFMGTTYNQFVVSSNAYISFETACATAYSTWSTEAIPNPATDDVRNSILGPWQDIDPTVGGTLRYSTQGTAPNRRMVVNYQNVPMYDLPCNSQLFTGQIIIYETSNVIENYIQNKTVCAAWNSGNAVQGLLDASGTVAVTVPGRNNTQWTTTNDGTRFTPTCSPCLIILNAAYREFDGFSTEEGNLIEWQTLYEEEMTGFALERSRDGVTFEEIEMVKAKGSAEEGSSYQMIDPHPFPVTYYRLREITINGEVSFSNVISVQMDASFSPIQNLYVDENTNELVVKLDMIVSSPYLKFRIVDGIGRQILERVESVDVGQHELRFDLQDATAGYYVLELQDGKSYRDVQRFINR